MPRQSVSSGERGIPAEEYTALLRAERIVSKSQRNLSGQTIEELYPPLITWVKNSTESPVNAFGVLGLDAPLIAPTADASAEATIAFRSKIAFSGIAPLTATPHYGKYAILQEPAAAGEIVRAVMGGVCFCKLLVNDADDVAADIANSTTSYLTSQPHGSARILWKESGTGEKWALVHVGSWVGAMLGKTDASHAKGASGTVSVWAGAEGSEVDTGVNVTAYNRFGDIAITKWVMVLSLLGRLYIVAAECD
jgi:hypothetical protein